MDDEQYLLIERITNNSLVFISIMTVPITLVAFLALQDSPYQIPRFVPPIFAGFLLCATIFRKKIPLRPKIQGFTAFLFLAGCFNLLIGLIDMAGMWLILAIVYCLFIAEKNEALLLLCASVLAVVIAGILMMTKVIGVPLDYQFNPCQFVCVTIRLLHFLMIGALIYYILGSFHGELRKRVSRLRIQSQALEEANTALEMESKERRAAQRKLLEAVILTEEEERKRIAADLHDGLGPVLATVKLIFQAFTEAGEVRERDSIGGKLKAVIDSAIQEVSRIAHDVSPQNLDELGVKKALENFSHAISTGSGISISIDFQDSGRFDRKRELTLYRAFTELIHNTVKHSGASEIQIRCRIGDGRVTGEYSDDGRGFPVGAFDHPVKGMGLGNLRNRFRSLGGWIKLGNADDGGMSAQIELPLAEEEAI